MDLRQYVRTPALFEAVSVLKDKGYVLLCGPPGCGKTTLARALLRRYRHEGFKPYTLRQIDDWDTYLGQNRHRVALLDGILGEVQVNRQQHACWKHTVDTARALIRKGTLKLVVTVYPHVLRQLRLLEKGWTSPLHDETATVSLTEAWSEPLKEKLLIVHLKKLNIEVDRQREVVLDVLRNDASGSGFPWCCDHMVNNWEAVDYPLAIFALPAEAHSRLLKEMVLHSSDGSVFAAVFALKMGGMSNFLKHPETTERRLQELGFRKLCADDVEGCAHILQDSILAEGQFASRVMYEAAGLALGRFFRLPVLLKVCDAPFLVQYVDMTAAGCVTVGSVPSCSENTQQCTQHRHSLVERIYTEVVQGNLQYICQHPCLHSPEFLQELDNHFAKDGRKRMKLLLNAVDSVHKLPLLYWSVFHPSTHLTLWCLSKNQVGKQLAAELLLAHTLFDHIAQIPGIRRLSVLHSTLTPEHFKRSGCVMHFPFVAKDRSLTQEMQKYVEIITGTGSVQERLLYLSQGSLPIPADVVAVQVSGDKLQVRVKNKLHWYLVFRLLTDREVNQTDQHGNPLLHVAVNSGGVAAVRVCLEAGAVITQKNRQGVTGFRLAHRTRVLAPKSGAVQSSHQVFTHITKGNKVEEQVRLLQELNVNDKDGSGKTGLLVACEQGQGDIADLYIELGADVHVQDKEDATPLHHACGNGLVHTVERLLQSRASFATATISGKTALHFACSCSSHTASAEITRCLVELGADINTRDVQKDTPLLCAVMHGLSVTAELLIGLGVDINTQNELGDSPLLWAVRNGHTDTVKLLAHRGAHTNTQNEKGESPLLCAAEDGHSDIAEILIHHGAEIDTQNKNGDSPLLCAVRDDLSDTVELLILHGAETNTQNVWGVTPLMCAAENGHSRTAELLVHHDADTNARNKDGVSPLLCAAENGHSVTAELLIRHGAEVDTHNEKGESPLLRAVRFGHSHTAELLIHLGAKINTQNVWGDSPLLWAVRCGLSDTAELLVRHGAETNVQNERGDCPLLWAVRNGLSDTAELLMHHGAGTNTQNMSGVSPLLCAATNGQSDTAERLIGHGAEINAQNTEGESPLLCAARHGRSVTVELLIHHGAEINAQNEKGESPLLCAVSKGHSHTAELLIRRGAGTNTHNMWGNFPLLCAAENGHSDTAELLIRHGAQINVQTVSGDSPLLMAARNGHSRTAELLIHHGADTNAQNKDGVSPLLCAAENGHLDTAELLIGRGAEISTQDAWGDTPLLCAAENGHSDTVELLIRHGAETSE